ncbi:Ku protein [Amycolatopsis suaedae]|uniref:Non-homologous end joining protein Ku n=1 Tax=Amycolatopsis suaedae TaxID=2510978 RepID=A0A4Q7JAH9_9PSEU|nr:Ku protein [Amycolatopsis suaedae]RZQ64791.1 Ku protein [Amycolatopsis suaedae]
MRAVWKGTIGFGGYAIPVKAYSATAERDSGLHQLHLADGGRIRYKRVCELDGAEVPWEEVGKGVPTAGGDVVVLGEEDLARLPLPAAGSIRVCTFVRAEEIDPIWLSRAYHLEPDVAGLKAYLLLSEALQRAQRVAVVKVVLRQRETLALLRVRDQVLLLETMYWRDELREPDFPFRHEDVELSDDDLRAATELVEELSGPFRPSDYTDGYRRAVAKLVKKKVEGDDVLQPAASAQDAAVSDLLAAMRTTVAERERRSAVRRAKTAARKAAAAKAAATRAARRAGAAVEAGS